jgi:broad specificity phosphatase PhoE
LTENGKEQAKRLGERLSNEQIDVIISSDLDRVRDTIEEVRKHHKLVPIIYDEQARERNFGVFEGRHYQQLLDERQRLNINRFEHHPQGGESYLQFRKRAEKFFEKVYKEHTG